MSQAATLLASLTDTASAYSSSEGHIIIGDDRFITVPESLKRLAVQYDHDVETVTFDCPRFWDEHDMFRMVPYINYLLPNGTTGQYKATNVSSDSSRLYFDWTISNNVTKYKGKLSFLVCIKKTDEEGYETNHWNSELNQDCYISEGLECTQTAVTRYPDIITQLLTRMDEVEAIATPEAMQAYTDTWLEENRESIASLVNNEGNEALRTKADAIICSTQGETISVSDSSDDYLRGLRVFGKTTQVTTTGKNLLNMTATSVTKNGVSFSVNDDNSITVTGTASSDTFLNVDIDTDINTEHINVPMIVSLEGGSANIGLFVGYFVDDTTHYSITSTDAITEKSFEYPETALRTRHYIKVPAGVSLHHVTVYPMIRLATIEDTTYEPYSGGVVSPSPEWPQELRSIENVAGHIYGKNLCTKELSIGNENVVIADFGKDISFDALTFSIDLVNASMVNTGSAFVNFEKADKTPYYITSASIGLIANTTYNKRIKGTARNITCKRVICYFKSQDYGIWSGEVKNAQLELGTVMTDYEPYVDEQSITIPYTLPGIPVSSDGNYTDSNGQQWICDEVDFERGVFVQRIKTFDLASISVWRGQSGWANTSAFFCDSAVADAVPVSGYFTKTNMLCNRLAISTPNDISNTVVNAIAQGAGNGLYASVDGVTTADDLKNYFLENETIIQYVLATPIETALTAEEIESFKQLHTNYPNTVVLNNAGAWTELKYNADTEIWVDNRIAERSALKSTTVTLYADKWVETSSGYSQVVTMNGVTANSKIDLQPSPDQLASLVEDEVSLVTGNNNSVVTIYAIGASPSSDMTMQVLITEVRSV